MSTMHYTGTTITVRRSAAVAAKLDKAGFIPSPRNWRKGDPPHTSVSALGPDDLGGRVVIRSGEFLGTVCGTLIDVFPHPSLVHFTCVQLLGKKPLTFRDDTEAIVMDATCN